MMDAALLGTLTASDPDVLAYIAAVEAADGQALEIEIREAINTLITGIKSDGDFSLLVSIFCLCVPRTLNGCLVAMKGPNMERWTNFVEDDIQRGRGMIGNGTNKTGLTNTNMNTVGSPTSGLMMTHIFDYSGVPSRSLIGSGPITSGIRLRFGRNSGNLIVSALWDENATITVLTTAGAGGESISAAIRDDRRLAHITFLPTQNNNSFNDRAPSPMVSGNTGLYARNGTTDVSRDRIAMVYLGNHTDQAATNRLMARSRAFTNSLRAFFGN